MVFNAIILALKNKKGDRYKFKYAKKRYMRNLSARGWPADKITIKALFYAKQ